MAESNPTAKPATPAAKSRNPVEKIIVRGFIAIMLVLVAIEANSWWQHKQAFAALSAKTKAVDEAADAPVVTEADIKAYFQGKKPSRSPKPEAGNNFNGASRIDVYSWFTISPVNKRDIYVYYGRETSTDTNGPEVLAIQVKDEAPPRPPQVASGDETPAQMGPPPGMMAPGMGGPGPGGARRGRPGGGESASTAPDGEKAAGDKPEDDSPAGDKPADDKSGDDKPNDDKPNDEKPNDEKTDKNLQ
jgi:hypothetical protein